MVRLWWPQPARPPPQRWRQAAEHSEAPPRGCAATARHHMPSTTVAAAGKAAAVVVVPAVVRRRGGGEGWNGWRVRRRFAGKIRRKGFPAAAAVGWLSGDNDKKNGEDCGGVIMLLVAEMEAQRRSSEVIDGKVFRSPENVAAPEFREEERELGLCVFCCCKK
ncbi:hypothetical protein Tco_0299043 [Tanacetum coccineum]